MVIGQLFLLCVLILPLCLKTQFDNGAAHFLKSTGFLLLDFESTLFALESLDLFLVTYLIVIFTDEAVKQDSKEKIEQNKVANENPTDVVCHWCVHADFLTPHGVVENRVPVFSS